MPLRPLTVLLIAATAAAALTLAAVLGNTWRVQSQLETRLHALAGRERAGLLARALEPALAQRNAEAAQAALAPLSADPALRYAAVFTPERRVLARIGDAPGADPAVPPPGEYRTSSVDGVLRSELPVVSGASGRLAGFVWIGLDPSAYGQDNTLLLQNAGIVLGGLVLTGFALLRLGSELRGGLGHVRRGLDALAREDYELRLPALPAGDLARIGETVNLLAARLGERANSARSQQMQLRQESRRLGAMLRGISAVVWEAEPRSGRFRYVSPEAEVLLGHAPSQWLAPDFLDRCCHAADREWAQGFLGHAGASARSHTMDLRLRHRDGSYRWLRLMGSGEQTAEGPILTGLLLDVTEEKLAEQRVAFLADHDSLTGLVNRRRFQELLQNHIDAARQPGASPGALLFLDLDQFKYINDSYGHHTGDEYLRQVTQHLRVPLAPEHVLGRLGGDEFGVILPGTDPDSSELLCRTLLATLNAQEFIHQGRSTPFPASIGVAYFPQHGIHTSELLANADTAMYEAKAHGRNTWCVFEGGGDLARMREKIHWEDRIRTALRDHRLMLVFQPIVDLRTGKVVHYESLLRMLGDQGETIGPNAFIAVAERFGLIRELDRWVVETAIATQGASRLRNDPVSLTINLSARHFGSADMLELIRDATHRHRADPGAIVFEVTETAAVENFTAAREFIQALRNAGYRFALDDFGAGFSSFHYLKNLTVDYVKIDGSFVRHLGTDRADRIFVKAIADLAIGLGIRPIAEFVENRATVEHLLELGIPLGQGMYFAAPTSEFIAPALRATA